MAALTDATLSEAERRVLERFVALLREDPAIELRSVWLYGSRARGERPGPDSDVDVLVITDGGRRNDTERVDALVDRASETEGVDPFALSVRVRDPSWLADRRAIRSFFVQEVDRDKIVLAGES